jgi:hypothetical protein
MRESKKDRKAIAKTVREIQIRLVGYPSRQESYGDGSTWTDIVEVPLTDMETIYWLLCRLEQEMDGISPEDLK